MIGMWIQLNFSKITERIDKNFYNFLSHYSRIYSQYVQWSTGTEGKSVRSPNDSLLNRSELYICMMMSSIWSLRDWIDRIYCQTCIKSMEMIISHRDPVCVASMKEIDEKLTNIDRLLYTDHEHEIIKVNISATSRSTVWYIDIMITIFLH